MFLEKKIILKCKYFNKTEGKRGGNPYKEVIHTMDHITSEITNDPQLKLSSVENMSITSEHCQVYHYFIQLQHLFDLCQAQTNFVMVKNNDKCA